MKYKLLFLIIFIHLKYISPKCIWYEGIRDGFNQVYRDGEPKPLPLEDISLLNEMCPHIPTIEGVAPLLCCDRKQIAEIQKFKYIVDNLIGRCPSCYYNFLRIFCEMSCNPDHDQFIWPLEFSNITRPSNESSIKDNNDEGIRKDWALPDYVDPDEEQQEEEGEKKVTSKAVTKPVEKVEVITKIRYFISEEQANNFINSCWSVRINFQYAVDILCGSLNRACDVKKLFQYIGLKNAQAPIKIDFVFVNGTYFDSEIKRTFKPSIAKMFACDQPVILPHLSREKCTCMDCNSMCPKINNTKKISLIPKNGTLIQKFKAKVYQLHIVTIIAIGIYFLFVIMFIFSCLLICIWNMKSTKKSYFVEIAPLFVIEFLHRIMDVFEDYFGECTETSLKDNYVIVYELLDEMLDSGLPLATETNILKELIKPPNIFRKVANLVTGDNTNISNTLPSSQLSNIPWRRMGVKYTNNEAYFDLIEEIDAIIDRNGATIMCEIQGYIDCCVKLSGMPDLTLSFVNPRLLDDVSFHPCVRLKKWESERVLSFIPPDGNFRLISYHIGSQNTISIPIYVKHNIQFREGSSGRFELTVGPKQTMGKTLEAVVIECTMPKSVLNCTLTPTQGKSTFDPVKKILVWDIGKIESNAQSAARLPSLRGNIVLSTGQPIPESNPILNVRFTLNQIAISGIRVQRVDMHGEKYKPFKGVKYITTVGKGRFQIRT
ncbi:unnamed protein product [Rotaria sp. Silwood2]|nr:unnamed protein product [Rotaria sp. Silwood2]